MLCPLPVLLQLLWAGVALFHQRLGKALDYRNLNLLNPAIKNVIAAQYGEEELGLMFG